jgi:hypothetical protein
MSRGVRAVVCIRYHYGVTPSIFLVKKGVLLAITRARQYVEAIVSSTMLLLPPDVSNRSSSPGAR